MIESRFPILAYVLLPLLVVAWSGPAWAVDEVDEVPTPENASSEAALARAREAAAESAAERERNPQVPPSATARLRVRNRASAGDPVYRNGVPYYDEWTIRAGASRLRLPAYPGWESVSPNSEFYRQQSQSGAPGEHLAAVLTNKQFTSAAKTKYVSFYSLIWVPQEHAFSLMFPESFAHFKDALQEETIATRKRLIARDDFKDFDDYLNFKFGNDEAVDDFVDGFWVRAVDEADTVIYFATSQFVYQTPRTEIVDSMIMTVSYALVENKLVRVDMKRLYTSEDDIAALIAFTQLFLKDFRNVNGLGGKRGQR